jgi:serine/threonine protein kinase
MSEVRVDDPSEGSEMEDRTRLMRDASEGDDPRLMAAVQEYVTALEAGGHPSRKDFVARHPAIAAELGACLDALAFVHSAAVEMPGMAPARAEERHVGLAGPAAQPLGDFRLVREIGRGGMGTVYEAVQLSLGRRVAVKVLPMAAAMDRRHLERFRNEAQAAAQLHHTNIVPVYAVGCERSVHFYAMQLIEGASLADVIRDLRQLAGKGGAMQKERAMEGVAKADSAVALLGGGSAAENLSVLKTARGTAYARSVAQLGLQVAEALDYAHRAGIVHRDIKPANLLLDARGTLWITDFGLAQFYVENGLTRSGDLLGTMRYMSPEQASGRAVVLDQRTDIYSLGVTLYELLTLERALTGATHAQLLDELAHHEPRPARMIDKTVPRELEVILSKAIAKEPSERYSSARAMAEDLARFLRDEPILAKPPSTWDRAVKWTRRHKSLALSALVTLTLAAIGLLITTLLVAREQGRTKDAYELERAKATEARDQRLRAERSGREARAAVDFFSQIAVEMDRPEFSDVRREMLEESLSYYQTFLEEHGDDPTVGAQLDAARSRVSMFLGQYQALDEALSATLRARLLSDVSVRRDLNLTAAEVTEASALWQDTGFKPGPEMTGDLRQMSVEERRTHFAARAAETDAALHRILGDERAGRLRQIYRQVRGPLAFGDPDVDGALGLDHGQKGRLRYLQSQYRNSRFMPGPWGAEQSERLKQETMTSILAVLTPAQKAKWSALVGAPFEGKIFIGGPGGRRGGPGGGEPFGGGMGGRHEGHGEH